MTNLSDYFGPVGATAEQWDIKNGKTAYIPAGKVTGSGYFPAMMEFDGSTGYYSDSSTVPAHTGVTCVCQVNVAAFTGGGSQYIFKRNITAGNYVANPLLHASDYATAARRNKLVFAVQNSGGTLVCRVFSSVDVCDGDLHTLFMSYNATAGTAVLVMDGVDVLDTGNAEHILTTGTLPTGAATYGIGAQHDGLTPLSGLMGFIGYREASLTNWSDFMQTDGSPKQLDESTWTEWGAQPLFWHESGKMDENKGSAGAMTKNGTITLAAASIWS